MEFINNWINHPMESNGRDNLEESDKIWDTEFDIINNGYVPKGTLLYRVHTGGDLEPKKEDYDDRGEQQNEIFDIEHRLWEEQNNMNKIKWDNHWVSFTKNPDIIGSNYFLLKSLRGFVIVIKSMKAIDISKYKKMGFDEHEVVAPMDKNTCIDILKFDDYKKKYGTGNSDHEKENTELKK